MLSRRRLPLLLLALASPRQSARAAEAAPASPVAFIRAAGNQLAAILAAPISEAAKRRRLGAFLARVVDIPAVARFCLGRFWPRATAAERAGYVRLFHGILLDSVMARAGAYRATHAPTGQDSAGQLPAARGGMRVVIGRPVRHGDAIDVPTTVARPGAPAAQVTWVVREEAGGLRIFDLRVAGTSLRVTVRADYDSFLSRHGDSLPALLAAMRRQITQAERTGGH